MKNLNNKVALLTGASSGIGAVIANLLAQENVTVVGVARSKSGLNTVSYTHLTLPTICSV